MSDKDVPSVPVTTLAGLTSLSDLLSELPISDSISSITSTNKSLLFHTLVAEESNHLLSVRDDNLVRQLVQAIEQTNSDHIELKSQYTINQLGTNISEYPELLQGIYTFRPTVFNTPQSQRTQTNINSSISPSHFHQQQQNKAPASANLQSPQESLIHSTTQQAITTRQRTQQINTVNNSSSGNMQTYNLGDSKQNTITRSQVVTNAASLNNPLILNNVPQSVETHLSRVGNKEIGNDILQQQQYQPITPSSPQFSKSQHPIQQQQNFNQYQQQHQHQQQQQQQLQMQHHLQFQQQNSQLQHMPHQQFNPQQNIDHHIQEQQIYQSTQQAINNFNSQQQHLNIISQQNHQLLQNNQIIGAQNISPAIVHNPTYQQNLQLMQQQQQQQHQQQFLFQQQQNQIGGRNQMQQQITNQQSAQILQQKATPRNNEYLEQQSKNFDIRGPSPAQGCVAPDSNAINTLRQQEQQKLYQKDQETFLNQPTFDYKTNDTITKDINATAKYDSNGLLIPKVCISRLKAEDEDLMQRSLKKFAQKSPVLAKKLGLTGASPVKLDSEVKINQIDSNIENDSDMFSQMKADEKRNTLKRKMAIRNENIPPEEIFTKPKVRRVERILAPSLPKTSKEEVMKSQTYQQFMRNMDHIIEQLDDTEPPNFNSDETDEAVECISPKMLTVVSNDVAKLKAKGVLDSVPKNKLTLLINYAMRNIYLARNYSAGPDVEEEFATEDSMEKILHAMEACLLICNIYSTAQDLKFLQEDNVSIIIKFVQFQFRETIFPSYDSVYTVKNMKKADYRKKKQQNHNRSLQLLYSKSVELMKVFVTLFDKCLFVDTIVLSLSTLAVEPFFVDNVETLQFVCLELVTTIFRKEQYVNMRSSILSDILASVDRLPCSKKHLRPFKLGNGGNIQMVTALLLQLIQCATVLPESICKKSGVKGSNKKIKNNELDESMTTSKKAGNDLIVIEKYDTAVSIGGNFLTTFLNKCKTRSSETDFRPLFENFIHDLLATVNKPEWPAAELLLSLLGTLLVKYMSDKTIEQSIRLASLDYLGIVAARLRKDTVESRCKVHTMDQMIKCIKAEQEKEGDFPNKNNNIALDPEEERTEFLQKILLDFLAVNAQEENLIWDYARHFYLAQWYRDIMQQRKRIAEGEKGYASRKKTGKKNRRKLTSSESSSENDDDDDKSDSSVKNMNKNSPPDQELNLEIFKVLDERKTYLLGKIKPYSDINCTSQHIKTYIDYNNAHLIAQYLASKRPFSQSFDKYLQKIILVVREPAIAIRTRAMKCLANIVEVDPLILKRKDMQMGVNQKFLDTAISVREAAVDLIGKYVLSSEELIDQYYEMLSTRILDTGVSVRKRVIKILRDICIEYPDYEKIPEICVKMIRRVNDEEGIQKLVTDVFMRMWFTSCRNNDRKGVQRKITQIIDVVNLAHDTSTSWLDGLLSSIFTPKESNPKTIENSAGEIIKKNTEPPAEVVLACQQLADGLVERLIQLEDTDNSRMLGCITTMHLLAKVRPQLLVRHAITIEPYLNIKCHSAIAPKFISSVAEILEKVVPLMEHPSDSFLADLEEHLMMLVVSLNQSVVLNCLSCLGAVVNKITKNYKLIRDCFSKFYKSIAVSKEQLVNNPNLPIEHIYQPLFRRSLYTIGIFMRFFDFSSPVVLGLSGRENEGDSLPSTICDEVFECIMFFVTCTNFDIRKQALVSLGQFCVQNDEYLTKPALREYYVDLLTSPHVEPHIKTICMRNIWVYLTESEIYMHNKEKDWQIQAQTEDLKEMNDVSSGMASRIIQLYLTEILDCFLHTDYSVRLWAVKVIQIVLRQGLVHPVRMVPYLICLSTDDKLETAHRADALLKEIDRTYSGFVNMKLQFGLQLSFRLQQLLQSRDSNRVVRGYTIKDDQPVCFNDFLYSLLRNTKPQRRALILTITKQFDDQRTTLPQMLYFADNLAYFPYVVQDEPLYLIHHIDIMISVTGTNLLANFKEGLKPPENPKDNPLEDEDDEDDKELLYNRLPEDTSYLQQCITSAQGCMLLLILKQHLKDMYGITDGKISRYSPSEPQKIYEKAVTKKTVSRFNPKSTIEVIKKENMIPKELDEKEKRDLLDKYLDFKQLMLKLDPEDSDSQDEERQKVNNVSMTTPSKTSVNPNLSETPEKIDNINNAHINNVFNAVMSPVVTRVVGTITPAKNTKTPKTPAKKQPPKSRRKKKKILSSEEEDTDYSDNDYM